jgi:hypothetical protein
MVLMSAIPLAAAAPARKVGGRYQKAGNVENRPIAVTVMTAMVMNGESMYSARGIDRPTSSSGPATWKMRSPVRSECFDQISIATAPTANGIATIRLVSSSEKEVSKVSAKPATIVGRKKERAKRL